MKKNEEVKNELFHYLSYNSKNVTIFLIFLLMKGSSLKLAKNGQ